MDDLALNLEASLLIGSGAPSHAERPRVANRVAFTVSGTLVSISVGLASIPRLGEEVMNVREVS